VTNLNFNSVTQAYSLPVGGVSRADLESLSDWLITGDVRWQSLEHVFYFLSFLLIP
jgi:hypothetical protein